MSLRWPETAGELAAEQARLGTARPPPWRPGTGPVTVAGCFFCSAHGDEEGRAWAAAAVVAGSRLAGTTAVEGRPGGPYRAGLLALREGPLLAAALEALAHRPTVVLVDATGRDHPRRAGLALHLGAVLGAPTVGVTHRPLLAAGAWPPPARGATAPLRLDGEEVGRWVRTVAGARPLAVHAAWRTDPAAATAVVLAVTGSSRTPEPLRHARRTARLARAVAEGRAPGGAGPGKGQDGGVT